MITDEDDIVKEKSYESFGIALSSSGTLEDNREFTGKEKDKSGFHYFGARYYSGDIGRFLIPDPHTLYPGNLKLANSQELNPYVYCGNNPTNFVDLNGLYVKIPESVTMVTAIRFHYRNSATFRSEIRRAAANKNQVVTFEVRRSGDMEGLRGKTFAFWADNLESKIITTARINETELQGGIKGGKTADVLAHETHHVNEVGEARSKADLDFLLLPDCTKGAQDAGIAARNEIGRIGEPSISEEEMSDWQIDKEIFNYRPSWVDFEPEDIAPYFPNY